MGSIDHEFQEAVRQGITVKELEEISERSAQFVTDARKASHTMVLAGVQFRRAANEWVPKIKAGEEGARTALENELTKAAQHYAQIGKESCRERVCQYVKIPGVAEQ